MGRSVISTLRWLVLLPLWDRLGWTGRRRTIAATATGAVWVIIIAAAAASGGGSSSSQPETAAALPTPTPTAAAESPTPTATIAPTATPTPPPSITDAAARAYDAHDSFMARAASPKSIEVRWHEDRGLIEYRWRDTPLNEGDAITIAGHTLLVAAAALADLPTDAVQAVQVTLVTEFINQQTGQKSYEPAVRAVVTRETLAKWDLKGQRELAYGDNKRPLCNATSYAVHPAIWRALKDPGCLVPATRTSPGWQPEP